MSIEEARGDIHQGADKIASGAHNFLILRDDVSIVLTAVQRMMELARATYDRMEPALDLVKEGYVQAATAGEGTREHGLIGSELDNMMPIMENLGQHRATFLRLVEAAGDLGVAYGFERYPEQLEADAIAAGAVATRLHSAANQL